MVDVCCVHPYRNYYRVFFMTARPPICCAEAFKNVKVTATHLTHLGRSELECAELNSKEWFKHGWEAAIAAMQLTKYDENVSKENVSNANDISVVDVLTRRKPNHTQKDVDNFLGYDVASSTKLVSQREISDAALLSIAAELWPMAQVQTQIGEGIEDAENRIAAFLRPYLRQPVPVSGSVSLEKCARAAMVTKDSEYQSSFTIPVRAAKDIAKAVLDAAGVNYVD